MRVPVPAAAQLALLATTLVALAGCHRAPNEVAPTDTPPPEGVLRAYVWECDGGLTLRMKNLYRENAITLEMHEGPRKLPQVVSASGAKYADGSLMFWTKGSTAMFERQGSPTVNCRELRAQSLLADARERGVIFRGIGNEPGWTVEIGPGARLQFVTNYGQESHEFDAAVASAGSAAGQRLFTAEHGAERIEVSVTPEACADDMSGEAFDHRMIVKYGGETRRGCAMVLQRE